MGIFLKNGLIVTQNSNREILKGDILIENDTIKKIDSIISDNNHKIFDFSGLVIIPGFVQTHVHLCQTLFRNLADDLELLDWLEKRIWPFEMSHTPESLSISARLGLAELLLGGTTCILDMGNAYYQDIIFKEMLRSGIRGFSGKVMMDSGDHPYREDTQSCLYSTEELIKKWHGTDNSRIQYALAPRFVPSCSAELWKGVKELSDKYGLIIHSHAAENRKELELVKSLTGYQNIEFFVKKEIASSRLCLAHCIWVSDPEIQMMAETGIQVLHCPSANLKLGSGIAPVPKFIRRGINVSLGADGAPCNNNLDIFMEMRLSALIQKHKEGIKSTSAQQIFDMANLGGAKALGLEAFIGSLEPGKKADLVVMDLNKIHSIPADNIYSQIVYSAHASDVKHVMIDGKWVVFDQLIQYDSSDEIIQSTWNQIHQFVERISDY